MRVSSYANSSSRPRWHFLYFFPLPQGHGSLRPTRSECAFAPLRLAQRLQETVESPLLVLRLVRINLMRMRSLGELLPPPGRIQDEKRSWDVSPRGGLVRKLQASLTSQRRKPNIIN